MTIKARPNTTHSGRLTFQIALQGDCEVETVATARLLTFLAGFEVVAVAATSTVHEHGTQVGPFVVEVAVEPGLARSLFKRHRTFGVGTGRSGVNIC